MAEDATPEAPEPRRNRNPYGEQSPDAFAPLAAYNGERPPAPDWFNAALEKAPEESIVETPRGKLELLTWGEVGKPGVLLIHGTACHAHWWAFIAPFLADHYRVAAFSFAGHGGSDWRDHYSSRDFGLDAEACARAAGLYESGRPPIYVGHSLGGAMTFCVAEDRPEQMSGAVLVDCSFKGPKAEDIAAMAAAPRERRIHASEVEAIMRFRLTPPQPARAHYIIDYIARTSLGPTPRPDNCGLGFAWRHDPALWGKLELGHERGPFPKGPVHVKPPLVHLVGDRSHVSLHRIPNGDPLGPEVPVIALPDCGHHFMVDQPMALVATLRTLLAVWPT
jgi:pimeloyl-ACP methyl ester carboxylesterase